MSYNDNKPPNYYQQNKEKILKRNHTKVECECGSIVGYGNLSFHRKSTKHLIYIQGKNSLSKESIPQASYVENPKPY